MGKKQTKNTLVVQKSVLLDRNFWPEVLYYLSENLHLSQKPRYFRVVSHNVSYYQQLYSPDPLLVYASIYLPIVSRGRFHKGSPNLGLVLGNAKRQFYIKEMGDRISASATPGCIFSASHFLFLCDFVFARGPILFCFCSALFTNRSFLAFVPPVLHIKT